MFARLLHITRSTLPVGDQGGTSEPVPEAWLDSFAMRNFTNRTVFDDTLPVAAGQLEAGYRVPLDELAVAMEQWFRRKGWLRSGETLLLIEQDEAPGEAACPKSVWTSEPSQAAASGAESAPESMPASPPISRPSA